MFRAWGWKQLSEKCNGGFLPPELPTSLALGSGEAGQARALGTLSARPGGSHRPTPSPANSRAPARSQAHTLFYPERWHDRSRPRMRKRRLRERKTCPRSTLSGCKDVIPSDPPLKEDIGSAASSLPALVLGVSLGRGGKTGPRTGSRAGRMSPDPHHHIFRSPPPVPCVSLQTAQNNRSYNRDPLQRGGL